MFRRIAIGLAGAALAAGAVLAAPAAQATPAAPAAPALQATTLASTIALSNCSASLVRFPSSLSTDRAMMLTNGHCYENGFLSSGEVLTNVASTRSGTLLSASGSSLGTVRADRVLYATMTGTDVTLYRLNTTFASIQSSFGATALTISNTHPVDGHAIDIPSSYWKQIWNCHINGFVYKLREDEWTWQDSVRYDPDCDTTHGTSGSPVIDSASGQIVAINNTGNDDGQQCTLNNPCEVDANGNISVHQGQSYAEETYWFTTCLDSANGIDLNKAGCLLTKPPGSGNTVTVTNPGNQTATVGTAVSLQMQATDSQSGQTLTYSATGLPAGLSINASTGLISGTPTTAQSTTTTVTARDTTGATGTTSFGWTVNPTGGGNCSGQKLVNPGFESTGGWTASSGVISTATSGEPAHSGTKIAWLDGYGTTHTDTLSQSVAVPAGCRATLTFYLHIDTSETGSTVYDKLTVTANGTSVASYSNVNKASGYVLRTLDLSSYAGQTVALKFTGTEDSSLQTSFVIDDTALTLS
ncbi:putative Ig domain-containing protein [Labedaea rhizosphaerae]|uniref:Trypsin-like peptidase n=1 Tax=Labedaea rhizosphaerae TaxID=598644 RepID=A0A4R6SCW9_LABRH|nr:putative Ig domain-containing protein [Labedaea rhizosphaerae]TDP97524.1 trypsin-like peptidase [Labedaea rhizosphaerae]